MGFCCCGSDDDKNYGDPPAAPPAQAMAGMAPAGKLGARPAHHNGHAPPPPVAQLGLSDQQILSFAENGYLHLCGVVPPHEVAAALAVIDTAYATGDHDLNDANPNDVVPSFRDNVAKHKAIIAPLAGTPLYAMVEQLMGPGKSWQPQQAQVALREPSEHLKKKGLGLHDKPDKNKWHIDGGSGKYAFTASSFSMLVGVCLSHGQEEDANNGQLLVWPGSHHVLHAGVRERVEKGLIKDPHAIFAGPPESRPQIGDPIRVLMRPGDAVLAHQRLGHQGGPNVGSHVRKNIYLRVMNQKHDKFLSSGELLNGSVFAEFHGVQDCLRRHGRPV